MAVTPDDIAVALGRTAPEEGSPEYKQWELWISNALLLITARLVGIGPGQVPTIDDLDQAKLDYVVREAVVAHIQHPDDATQVTTAVDDASASRTYRSGKGRVTILDEWWALLAPKQRGRAFSIRPSSCTVQHAETCTANTYVNGTGDVVYGGAYCSCGADIAGHPIYGVTP
ncbi:hypothetical protein KVF89_22395 [Nocardioides carbamazepini]|uniref:hypothetical protein n=1 Tax=Nocardioides carbamazepini TaxID=2854259 RepID=UPI00214A39C6|nr:hypothetical protein [Nocardioides carbamazepini]MCR1785307.1 hypothetical protein [Nocardioides carbamazepini]